MAYEEISCKNVKCRKEARCEWCNEMIHVGDRCVYRAYKFEGNFNEGRMHPECFSAMENSSHDAVSEGWVQGEPDRGMPLR